MALVLAGALQLLFGILRAGRFISLVPASVMRRHAGGDRHPADYAANPRRARQRRETGLVDIVKGNATFSLSAIAVAAGGLLVLWLWGSPLIRRVKSLRSIPGPLIAVLLGCVTTVLMTQAAPQQLASSATHHPAGVRQPRRSAGRAGISGVERVAQSVGVGGGGNPGAGRQPRNLAEPGGAEKLRPQNPPPSPNREMVAQGVGNLLSGVLGAMPITAVIVRSSVNVSNGAQSKLSNLYPRRTAANLRPVVQRPADLNPARQPRRRAAVYRL